MLIIGGGVIGLSVGRALARRGVRNISIIERNEFGREASWAAGGILAPQVEADRADDFFRLACRSRDLYRDFAAEIETETGAPVGLNTTGTLFVAFTENEETEFRARYDWQKSEGLAVEWLSGQEARQIESCISAKVCAALRFPNDFQIDNRQLVQALFTANQKLGVRLMPGCEALGLEITKGKVCGARTSQGVIGADVVLIAAGAWSSAIEAVDAVKVEPVRGQMLCFAAPQFARHVIYSSKGYLVPRSDGRLLSGSTTEHVGFDRRVTSEATSKIRSMAMQIAPALAQRPVIDSWSGFRPRASDGLPVLGASPASDGLFYATGHYRNGILLAPITGELVAEAIINGATSAGCAAFSPRRFMAASGTEERLTDVVGAHASEAA